MFGICVWEVEFYVLVMKCWKIPYLIMCLIQILFDFRNPDSFSCAGQKKTLPPEREKGNGRLLSAGYSALTI